MMLAYLLACQWLLASVSCVTAGAAAWLLLQGASRVWPALRTSRGVWLAAQGVVAAAALLPFLPALPAISVLPVLPASQRISLPLPITLAAAPQINLSAALRIPLPAARDSVVGRRAAAADGATNTAAVGAVGGGAGDARGADGEAGGAGDAGTTIIPLLATLWLVVYAAGLARTIARRVRARRMWRDLLAMARPLSSAELQADPTFSSAQLNQIAACSLKVLRTDAAISPMLIGVRKPLLLLPAHLDALSPLQRQMIIAHELHHLHARDPLCLAIASTLQTIFWFNPILRRMARQMEWALELNCDQQVLAGRPQHQRKQYAASLLQQWTAMPPTAAAAFNGATIPARLRSMQQNGLPALSGAATCLTAAALVAVLAAGAAFQPAFAVSIGTAMPTPAAIAPAPVDASSATAADAATPQSWRYPLDNMRVSSFFGVHRDVLATPHKGIDLAAAKGTPVHATASGIVVAAGRIAENHGRYGNTVIIEHGARRSLYAHLDSVLVAPGQHVAAGQLIGKVGATGFSTGPHLHLELRENGSNLDPAVMFADLDAHASPRALRVRRQQLPTKE